jgi:hypothetical protein
MTTPHAPWCRRETATEGCSCGVVSRVWRNRAPLAPDAPTLLECWRGAPDSQSVRRGSDLPCSNSDGAPEADERAPTSDAAARGHSGWLPGGFSSAHPPPDAEPRESGNLTSDGGSPSASYISPEDGPTDPAILPAPMTGVAPGIGASSDVTTGGVRQGRAAAACRPHKPESAVRVRPLLPTRGGEP